MLSSLTKSSFYGKTKVRNGISFNSAVVGDKINFAVYNNQGIIIYESFNNIDDLKSTILKESLTEREQFLKNLVYFLCDINESDKLYENTKNIVPVSNKYSSVLDIVSSVSVDDEDTEETSQKLNTVFPSGLINPNGPCIYAFTTNPELVKDAIKIGYTDQLPQKRLQQWQKVYNKVDIIPLGWWSSQEVNKIGEKVFFWDKSVHKKVDSLGYKNVKGSKTSEGKMQFFIEDLTDDGKNTIDLHYSSEFYRKYKKLLQGEEYDHNDPLTAKLLEDIIKEMKASIQRGDADFTLYKLSSPKEKSETEWGNPQTYPNTELQEECITNGVNAIKAGKKNILMAAVMRFGKTHATYEIIKRAGLKRILVTSGKADVRKSWKDDVNHIDFYKDFIFVDLKESYEALNSVLYNVTYLGDNGNLTTSPSMPYEELLNKCKNKTLIVFSSLQDLSGSLETLKSKHKKILNDEFDMLVVDETHYGSHANTWSDVTNLKDQYTDEELNDIKDQENEHNQIIRLNIKKKYTLQVSGTPYYILSSNEMLYPDSEVITAVAYSDMLKARDKWNDDHPNEDKSTSPYFGIPTLHKIGLRLPEECREIAEEGGMDMNISNLFKSSNGVSFDYEDAVKHLMIKLFGDGSGKTLSFLNNKIVEGNKVCNHTIMVLPRIQACVILKDLLNKIIDTSKREIICIVDNEGRKKDISWLNNHLQTLDNANKKSIILTVNRFLTGVSMPLVDSMIYLKNASSPQEYDQNIFRLCTRNIGDVENPEDGVPAKVNRKENVYLIDFNIANMFKMLANSARMKAKAEKSTSIDRVKQLMEEDLEYTPVFCEDTAADEITGQMKKLSVRELLKEYVSYNSNKGIGEIANDEIDKFNKIFEDEVFQNIILNLDVDRDTSKNTFGDEQPKPGHGRPSPQSSPTSSEPISNGKDKIKVTKEKFKTIIKNLLYCNLCLDTPYSDVDNMINDIPKNKELVNLLKDFKLNPLIISKVYTQMNTTYKNILNEIICKICILSEEIINGNPQNLATALKDLGRIDKNEVITPVSITTKMLNKLSKSDFAKATNILLVNEKCGEFFKAIHDKYNGKYDKKCKIVCSSNIGVCLTKKVLEVFGLKKNINDIILDITAKDFIETKKLNNMKFDICLMNPPYGTKGDTIANKMFNRVNEISDNVVSIQPSAFITKDKSTRTVLEEKKTLDIFNKFGAFIEIINEKIFDADLQQELAIIYISKNGSSTITFKNKFGTSVYNNASEINKYNNDNIINKFYTVIKSLSDNDSVYKRIIVTDPRDEKSMRLKTQDEGRKYYVTISYLRGNIGTDDMETFIPRDTVPKKEGRGRCYINFSSKNAARNFINYLKSDFARMSLWFIKNDTALAYNTKLVPWFDFSDKHFSKTPKEIDDYLFSKFEISKDVREKIEEILPDYYGIRN